MQPWQAYLNKFQNTKLKKEIDDAWKQYLQDVPEGEQPKKTRFEIRNKLARKLYAAETAKVKAEVEEHRKVMREGNETSDLVARNASFQRYDILLQVRTRQTYYSPMKSAIDMLPRTLEGAAESIAKKAGWNALIIVGGPNPRLGGKITTVA